ncbi:MAG: hypothetical protein ACM3PU_15390, partial [Gemmatimonadota bacterium]
FEARTNSAKGSACRAAGFCVGGDAGVDWRRVSATGCAGAGVSAGFAGRSTAVEPCSSGIMVGGGTSQRQAENAAARMTSAAQTPAARRSHGGRDFELSITPVERIWVAAIEQSPREWATAGC